MPTYELRCTACGHSYELFIMRMLRGEDMVCPQCGSTEVKRGVGGGVLATSSSSTSSGSSCGSGRFS